MNLSPDITDVLAPDRRGEALRLVEAVLDHLPMPIMLIGGAGRIEFANPMSEQLLRDGRHLQRAADGMLVMKFPGREARLDNYLSNLDRTTANISLCVEGSDGVSPIFASLSMFLPPALADASDAPPIAALIVRQGAESEGLELARQRFHLSGAETAVLATMMTRRSIRDHAEARGVSIHTARKQLASLMAKVGVSRQNELPAIVDSLIGRAWHATPAQGALSPVLRRAKPTAKPAAP